MRPEKSIYQVPEGQAFQAETMLQTLSAPQSGLSEDRDDHDRGFDLGQFTAIFRRRIFYFAVPFVVLLIVGLLIIAIQQPIYQAEGKILVESAQIPTNLVQPTVTATATERIEVIHQRIMTRDNLLPIVKKFGLFPSEQRWMSSSELLDLMRERAKIELLDIDTELAPTKDKNGKPITAPPRPTNANNKNNSAIAFTMGFEYENPELAMKVANEFLTLILNEDVRVRTDRATETTQFLAREVKRLQGELDSVHAQISADRQQPIDPNTVLPDQLKDQRDALAKMKTDLLQTTSVYSEAHPRVKALKKRIAALEQQIAEAPKAANSASPQAGTTTDIDALEQRQKTIEKNLDEASKKLITARLGESMERDQQAEHLQVIEQPALPQKPSKPNILKLFAISFALAAMVGVGIAGLAEVLDKTIHGSRDLAGLVDRHLLVTIPYISTPGEISRRKRKVVSLWMALAAVLCSGLAIALYIGIEIDFSNVNLSWINSVRKVGLLVH